MAVTLFAPLAWFAGDAGEFGLYAFALKTAEGEAVSLRSTWERCWRWPRAPLVTIFLFRRRLLQIRLCVVEIVLLLGCGYGGRLLFSELAGLFPTWRSTCRIQARHCIAAGLPVVSHICGPGYFLRDELLVRAADRIR